MSTMHLKNKFDVSFRSLITEAKKKGGVPKDITVTVAEARGILEEIKECEVSSMIGAFNIYKSTEAPDNVTKFPVTTQLREEMTRNDIGPVLARWMDGAYAVKYDNIPIIIVIKDEQPKVPKPEFPPNVTVKEGEVSSSFVDGMKKLGRVRWLRWK